MFWPIRKPWFTLAVLCCTFSAWAGGLSAWREVVPGGYELSHDGGELRVVTLDGLAFTSFYLYRGALVAQYDPAMAMSERQPADEKRYYIVRGDQAIEFSDAEDFQAELEKAHLVPVLTRWHDHEFGLRFWSLLLLFMLPIPLLLPIAWGLCVLSLLTPWQWRRRARLWFVLGYASVSGGLFLLLNFPQSI